MGNYQEKIPSLFGIAICCETGSKLRIALFLTPCRRAILRMWASHKFVGISDCFNTPIISGATDSAVHPPGVKILI